MGLAFEVESWIWYAIGITLVASRLVTRIRLLGSIRSLQSDDWIMLVAALSYTAFVTVLNKELHYQSNLIAPGLDVNTFSDQEKAERIYGSKLVVVVEQLQCLTIWLIKGCLLILYYRVTVGLKVNLVVRWLGVYMVISFIIMEGLYFGVWCRPFSNYWALPTPNPQCNTAEHHLIVNAVFNISSDLVMLVIAFSLFIGNRLPWHRKLILSMVFGLGLFTILSSVLNKYYSFSHPFGDQWTYWYVRESSTALIVANIPFTWTILRRIFKLKSFDGVDSSAKSVAYHSARTARARQGSQNTAAFLSPFSPGLSHHKAGSTSYASSTVHSPRHSRHASVQVAEHQAKKWKDAGVFGREDAECMGFDSWGSFDETTDDIEQGGIGISAPKPALLRTTSLNNNNNYNRTTSSSPSSPRSNRSRRLRDEEAQLAMQERSSVSYHDFEMDLENAFNEKLKHEEEGLN